jgi:hypothetical protein
MAGFAGIITVQRAAVMLCEPSLLDLFALVTVGG